MTFDPNKNNIYFYTNDCGMCGKVVFDTENEIRNIISQKGYHLVVKELPLYSGWRLEAQNIGEEIPFFYNYNSGTSARFQDIIEIDSEGYRSINSENLDTLLQE